MFKPLAALYLLGASGSLWTMTITQWLVRVGANPAVY